MSEPSRSEDRLAEGREVPDLGDSGGIDEELHINYPNGQWYGRARYHNF
jgi:hypothetical protein